MDAVERWRRACCCGLLVAFAFPAAATAPAHVSGLGVRSADGATPRPESHADRGRRSPSRAGAGVAAGDPLRAQQWALDAIHLSSARGAPGGAGALVAVVDSGIDATNPELAGRVAAGPDLVDGDDAPADANGHGTHIAGIIAAAAGNEIGAAGVAPGARLLAVRVLDETGRGTAHNVAAGIDAAVDAHADIINLSMNWSEPDDQIAAVGAAITRAADAGALVVVAAGNDAREQCDEPVLPRRALCVGGLTYRRKLAPSSNHGAGLGIVAPGEDLLSTWNDGTYRYMSGTSQAAAMTSGVAALLVGLGLHGDELMQRLIATARDIETGGAHSHPGAGALDAARAVDGVSQQRMPPVLRAPSPGHLHAGSVGRRGLLADCDAAKPGICHVSVRVGATIVAHGDAAVDGSDVYSVRAHPTRAGRRLLTPRCAVSAIVHTTLAGAVSVRRAVILHADAHAPGHSRSSRVFCRPRAQA